MLHPIKLVALEVTTGDHGFPPHRTVRHTAMPGESFIVDSETAEKLEAAGIAERYVETPAPFSKMEVQQVPIASQQVIVIAPVARTTVVAPEMKRSNKRSR